MPAKKPASPKIEASSAKAEPTVAAAESTSYAEQAAALADDTRALAESIRSDLADLKDHCGQLNQTAPEPEDQPAADAVRRVPMGVDEVTRALDGLVAVAVDLAGKAAR